MSSKEEIYKLGAGSDAHYTSYVGPPSHWDIKGAMQFRLLCAFGLRENHTLLDFGCGSLRAGRLFLPYLMKDKYYGIDPNKWLIDEAIEHEVGNDLINLKKPKFFYNDDFKCPDIEGKFDFILAQSVFSHTLKELADILLGEFSRTIKDDGLILATFVLGTPERRETRPGLHGRTGWVYPSCVSHEEKNLTALFVKHGLHYKRLVWYHGNQTWFVLSKDASRIPSDEKNAEFTGGTYG
jgi:cyclopropane fatty-acyl-phospholipid synthase-like methyltransferase